MLPGYKWLHDEALHLGLVATRSGLVASKAAIALPTSIALQTGCLIENSDPVPECLPSRLQRVCGRLYRGLCGLSIPLERAFIRGSFSLNSAEDITPGSRHPKSMSLS